MEETVTISKGEVVIRKPSAKERNNALIKAEQEGKDGNPSRTVFLIELLPTSYQFPLAH